jgi:hypothetical protein
LGQQVITGKVIDNNGQPLAYVSIQSGKTGKGTSPAADGSFRVPVTGNDELIVSMIGYVTQNIKTRGKTDITITLVPGNVGLGQIVLVGTRGSGRVKTETPVPLDNGSGRVKDQYNYNGKLVTDLYVSYRLKKSFTVCPGCDNVLNVHPDFGVAPGAKDWAYNTEAGGS